jgi:hypothetical protein
VRGIHDTTAAVLDAASAQGILPSQAADRLAEGRLAQLGHVRLVRTGRWPERG